HERDSRPGRRVFRDASARADGARLPHARLARRGRGHRAGRLSALAGSGQHGDRDPRRYLGTVVTRLCLDRMKSARARREIYVGQWLPEPVVDEAFEDETAGDLAHDISVAMMLLLERLSPLERASFLLHDVFGLDFAEVSRALGRGEAACRQL